MIRKETARDNYPTKLDELADSAYFSGRLSNKVSARESVLKARGTD